MKKIVKPTIYNLHILLFILLFFSIFRDGYAQSRWVEDRPMNFKINVPANYQINQLVDGTDKIHAFISPDQNLVIRVRAFKLNQSITDVQLQSIFEQNIIKGAGRIMDEASDLNGLPARWSGYIWMYNNVNTVLTNYYIARPDFAYVVWAICTENMLDQKTAEMSNILGSFTLINGHPQQSNSQIASNQTSSGTISDYTSQKSSNNTVTGQPTLENSGTSNQSGWSTQSTASTSSSTLSTSAMGVKVVSLQMGAGVNKSLDIIDSGTNFPVSEKQIHLVFDYQGNAKGQNFEVKWLSITHNCLVIADEYLPTVNGKTRVHSYIENGGNIWPFGNYRTEVWYAGRKLTEKEFSVGSQQKAATPTGEKLLGECYADVWLLPPGKTTTAVARQQTTTANTSAGTSQKGGVKQIVLDNQNNGYDFATGKVRNGHQSPDPDVLNEPWCTTNPALCGNWAKTGKSRLEDVKSAPASGYISDGKSFVDCQECPVNEVLVFKLKDGSYGKLMITKDEKTQTNSGCQHRITCMVEYPAFQ